MAHHHRAFGRWRTKISRVTWFGSLVPPSALRWPSVVENGHCNLSRSSSSDHVPGFDARPIDSKLEFPLKQHCLQRLRGGALDVGGHAAHHPGSARLVKPKI